MSNFVSNLPSAWQNFIPIFGISVSDKRNGEKKNTAALRGKNKKAPSGADFSMVRETGVEPVKSDAVLPCSEIRVR